MIESPVTAGEDTQTRLWSQHLQRRIMRLLLQHDESLFRSQFRRFFVKSTLPQIPLLQQYDRYMKLQTLSNELLDDIMPRIRRQLSLKTGHARLREEAPTRGDIDWPRTIKRSWSLSPGLPPLHFETRLRQRSLETPQNLLTVAVLVAYRQELRHALKESFSDEELDVQERQLLASADARAERELAAPYARTLLEQARKIDISALAQQITLHLRPGPSPYHDLLAWWQRFCQFRLGRSIEEQALSLTSKQMHGYTNCGLPWSACIFSPKKGLCNRKTRESTPTCCNVHSSGSNDVSVSSIIGNWIPLPAMNPTGNMVLPRAPTTPLNEQTPWRYAIRTH